MNKELKRLHRERVDFILANLERFKKEVVHYEYENICSYTYSTRAEMKVFVYKNIKVNAYCIVVGDQHIRIRSGELSKINKALREIDELRAFKGAMNGTNSATNRT